ncbi:ferroxidase fet3 [Zygosaccharomyces mellis]|uniref:Ferroxidase fet3 n=1 Tax=Zygosaccharomyces mellis TaxID=42258 RepID=A0A4C2ECD5_9SACH|nr:ferroxidase fet3 [Zygosaccharomyces mellis]
MILRLALVLVLLQHALCATHVYNWTTGWGYANPDGIKRREVITCNGEFPWPSVRVTKGDRVIINLTNGFNNSNTTLHVHGMFQNGSNQMDGPPMLTQCPIAPNDTFTYNFTVSDNAGAYWYHSHTDGQYEDGMRGLFIIDDGENNKNFPYDYDEEVLLEIGEWYDKTVAQLKPDFLSLDNPTGAEPIPQNLLINNTRNLTWNVEPNKTYLLRIVNTGGFVSQYFWLEDHEMEVVEVDGVVTEKNKTNMLYITVAQRYSVLVRTKNNKDRNYAIMQKYDDSMLDIVPKNLALNQTSYLTYDSSKPQPKQSYVNSMDDFLDDFYLVPYHKQKLLPEPDHRIELVVAMDNLISGKNYAFFNNITYTAPKVPTLMTVLSSGKYASNSYIYGTNTNTFVLKRNEIVEIVLNSHDTGTHPFHLHGHVFQTISRADAVDDSDPPLEYNPKNHTSFPQYPMMRDTIYVRPQSNFVIRFRADNPGVWFFHCHIEWHLMQGLAIVLVEDPEGIQSNPSQQLTDSHKRVCKNVGMSTEGNAAGTTDWFNLALQNKQEKSIPSGFTTKGYVAFVFSCVAGVLGLITITIYGLMDLQNVEEKVIEDLDIAPGTLLEEGEEEEIETNQDYAKSGKSDGGSFEDERKLQDFETTKQISKSSSK